MFSSTNQPKDRPGRGKSQRTKLIESMERLGKTEEGFYDILISKAFNPEDDFAIKEVLQRMHPAKKAVAPSIEWDYDPKDSPLVSSEKIISATANGDIPPDIAKMMLDSISAMMKIEEITDLKDRIDSLESSVGIDNG